MSAYQLRTPGFTCLVFTFQDRTTNQEIITRESAPIVRWAHGKPLGPLVRWCEKKWPGETECLRLEGQED